MKRALLWGLLLAAWPGFAGGQEAPEAPLSVSLAPVVRPRSGGPVWVEARFYSRLGRVTPGYLDIAISDGLETVARYRTGDLALTEGPQALRLMLPPVSISAFDGNGALGLRFRTPDGTYALPSQTLPLPSDSRRSLTVCLVASDLESRLAAGRLGTSFQLEEYDPESVPAAERTYRTSVSRLSPRDLPTSPLGYCCFDVVLVPGEGLARLQARQLDALRRWVEGGGSVCLLPRGGLGDRHVRFLNDLAGRAEPLFRLAPDGALEATEALPEGDGSALLRPGLGRAAVVLPDAQRGLDAGSAAWRRIVAFLWRVRRSQWDDFVTGGRWHVTAQSELNRQWQQARLGRYNEGEEGPAQSFTYTPVDAGALRESLMPRGMRMIPMGTLLLAFLLFLAAIGPLDYLVLGLLRRRALTWVCFPALCIGFTFVVVGLARHYMGSLDHTAGLVFVDVDASGRVLRSSRCEMAFMAGRRTLRSRVRNALSVPLDGAVLSYDWRWQHLAAGASVPRYAGRVPTDYTVTREARQWRPAFLRTTSFEPPALPHQLNWHSVDAAQVRTYRGRAALTAPLLEGRGFDGCLYYVHGKVIEPFHGDESKLRGSGTFERRWGLKEFLRQVSARPRNGFFALVSQTSPGGAGNFEDMSILDETDAGQWLLLAVERVGADYYVQRFLLRGEP